MGRCWCIPTRASRSGSAGARFSPFPGGAGSPTRTRKPGHKAAAPAGPGVVGNGKANPADLVRGLKNLINTFGAETVREVTAALAD